jgi:hypothetical protein
MVNEERLAAPPGNVMSSHRARIPEAIARLAPDDYYLQQLCR